MQDSVISQKTLLGHPRGLFILFFTEMWERFSFYGMRAILVLYLTAQSTGDNPGLEWTSKEALALYGWYGMFVYFMGIFGGLAADKWLGQKKSVIIGGIFIIIGQFALSVDSLSMFYLGLVLLVCGVGLLKPNISTMVGGLYKKGDGRRDSGFTIFYIGINIGALAAPATIGVVGEFYDWQLAFSLAGFGMILGQLVFVFGRKYLKGVGELLKESKTEGHLANQPLTKEEKDRVVVLLLSFLVVIVFWAAYEQAGGLMNLFARDSVDRSFFGWEVPTTVFQSLHAFYVVILGAPMAWLWLRWSKRGKESSAVFKMAVGMIIMAISFVALMAAVWEISLSAIGKIFHPLVVPFLPSSCNSRTEHLSSCIVIHYQAGSNQIRQPHDGCLLRHHRTGQQGGWLAGRIRSGCRRDDSIRYHCRHVSGGRLVALCTGQKN